MQTELDCVYLSATVATSSVSRTSSGRPPPASPAAVPPAPAASANSSRVTGVVLRFWVMVKPKTSRVSVSAGSYAGSICSTM